MRHSTRVIVGLLGLAAVAGGAAAEVRVSVERTTIDRATEAFRFKGVPTPNTRPVAQATIRVVAGTQDEHSERRAIYLGKARLPGDADDPKANFFFADRTDGGRLLVDLGAAVSVRQVNTYSWHPGTRAPQVYTLFAADGTAAGFDPAPQKGVDPATCGWTKVAAVDTRPAGDGQPGGQYGVSVADPAGPIGTYRYLLLDVSRTEADDEFGNTFYSKVDVIADRPAAAARSATEPAK